ncbi:MAG: hypothetical protein ACOYD1_07720 [Candidatus Nanopelagicales bacterium]
MMLVFSGHDRTYTVPAAIVAAAGAADDLTKRIAAGRVTGWDMLEMSRRNIGREWADKTLIAILADADEALVAALDSSDIDDGRLIGLSDEHDADILRGLIRETDTGFERLTAGGWGPWEPTPEESTHGRILEFDVAADLASAIRAGGCLVVKYTRPIAWLPPSNDVLAIPLTAALSTAADAEDWHTYAIVDELDVGAVLNLVRMSKGPKLESYTAAGGWEADPKLLTAMRSVDPPMLVELDEAMTASVISQVGANPPEDDTVTASVPADSEAVKRQQALPDGSYPVHNKAELRKAIQAYGRAKDLPRAKRHIIKRARALGAVSMLPEDWGVTAAGFREKQKCEYCDAQATQCILHSEGMAYIPVCDKHLEDGKKDAQASLPGGKAIPGYNNIDHIDPIAAASVVSPLPGVSPDPRAEKLRRYWSIGGRGGAKIRWGTPGDWRRCHRHLIKYLGPRAKGYCQLLHKRNTGLWTGSRLNAAATWPQQSTEEALMAALIAGGFTGPGKGTEMKDGIYTELPSAEDEILSVVTAGGFPVAPPDEWFADPKLEGPTPLTIDASGHVFGHIATFDVAHIGMPGNVHAPKSRSGYSFFKTGELVTASGAKVAVGNLTLAGGHALLQADAGQAVAHYDNTASAIADINVGEDRYGIWAAGALRPEATAEQIRALRASAPSGDWRPINGHLELVAVCQVNVPGFPITRARVASGAVMALVAAGARPLAEMRFAALASEALTAKVAKLEAALIASGVLLAEPEVEDEAVDIEPVSEMVDTESEATVSAESVGVTPPEAEGAETETKPVTPDEPGLADRLNKIRAEIVANRSRGALRARVHGPSL